MDDSARTAKQGREGKNGENNLGKIDDSTEKTAASTSSISFNGSAQDTFGTEQTLAFSAAEIDANSASDHQT